MSFYVWSWAEICVPAAPGARAAAGEGALCWSWHQSQSEGWWTCRTSLWSEENSRFPKDEINPGVFNLMVLYFTAIRQAISKALVAYYQKCEYIHVPLTCWCLIVCALGDAFQTCLRCSYLWQACCKKCVLGKVQRRDLGSDVWRFKTVGAFTGPNLNVGWSTYDWCLREFVEVFPQVPKNACGRWHLHRTAFPLACQ